MYDFQDYFNEEFNGQPYTVKGEELEDYLRLLDMLLENYLEFKGMGSQQKLFSRGLVITESELVSYFDMPPYFRERDICDPVLAAEADAAFEFIANRTAATKEFIAEQYTEPNREAAEKELLRFDYLRGTFSLNITELMSVLTALAVEIDRRYERIFGFLQDNISKETPGTGLIYALVSRITPRNGAEEAIPYPLDDKMYTYFFIRKNDRDGLNNSLVLQPMVKNFLMGVPDNGETVTAPFHQYSEGKNIPAFFAESAQELDYIFSKESKDRAASLESSIYIGAQDEETSLHLLSQYCSEHKERLYVLDLKALLRLEEDKQMAFLSELYFRLKLYHGRLAITYRTEDSSDAGSIEQRMRLKNILDEICRECSPKAVTLFGQKEEPGELAALLIPVIRVPEATVALRTEIWEYFLNSEKDIKIGEDINIPDLADYYEIPYGSIQKAAGHVFATSRTKSSNIINRRMVFESLRQLNQVDFSGLATFVNPVYTWNDITITDEQRSILKTACNRYRLRNRIGEGWGLKKKNAYGNGVSLLLYGPPGTGKTMAAHVIANELELPLYRVDISQISSKYIGETEKNMALIFKAAADANVILFFDEADALFAKRTEVSDSHDKFANNETAYLLQKIEEYNGMSILATNYYNNFDDAFVRRITYAVHMQSPDKETRYALWTTILPKTAEMEEGINFRFFADKFDLSGSNIKAILFNAAYIAGAEGSAIGARHIVRSMEYEFNKLGKLVNSSDFGEYEIYISTYDPNKAKEEKKTSEPRSARRRKV